MSNLEKEPCPKCGTIGEHRFVKSWIIVGKGGTKTRIESYKCLDGCRRKWRRGVNLNKSEEDSQ